MKFQKSMHNSQVLSPGQICNVVVLSNIIKKCVKLFFLFKQFHLKKLRTYTYVYFINYDKYFVTEQYSFIRFTRKTSYW